MPAILESIAEKTVAPPKRKYKPVPTRKLVKFVLVVGEYITGYRGGFYEYQQEFGSRVIESLLLRDGDTLTGLFSRQSGKSTVIASIADAISIAFPWLAGLPRFKDDQRLNAYDTRGNYRGFREGVNVGIYAPKQWQAQLTYGKMTDTFETPEAEQLCGELGLTFDTFNGTTLKLSNGSLEFASTASDNAKIEGPNYHLLILEEAQSISPRQIREGLMPMAAAHNGTIVEIGTCTTEKGEFYSQIRDNRSQRRKGGVRCHFYYPYEIVMRFNSFYARHVEKMKLKWGEDSDAFQLKYACKWLLERGMYCTEEMLFGIGQWPGCAQSMGKFSRRHPDGLTSNYSIVAGLDLGKKNDSSVFTVVAVDWDNPAVLQDIQTDDGQIKEVVLYRKYVLDWLEFQGDNYTFQFPAIADYIRDRYPSLCRVVVDSTNPSGDIACETFSIEFDENDLEVVPFVFGLQSKSEVYKSAYTDICTGRLRFPGGVTGRSTKEYGRFIEQMLNLKKEYKGSYMCCEAIDEANAHDDYPDSLVLALHAATYPIVRGVVAEDNMFFAAAC